MCIRDRCIKRATRHTVLGADISEPALLKAELLGAIDARLTDETLATCDLVIVALYPRCLLYTSRCV